VLALLLFVGGWCGVSAGALLILFWLHNSASDASILNDLGRSVMEKAVVGLVPWGLLLGFSCHSIMVK